MKVTVIGKKCTPRESFISRAEKKLDKLDRFFDEGADAKVTAKVEKSGKVVEVTIFNKGVIFRAQEKSLDMMQALDICIDSIVRQIRKNKTKLEKQMKDTFVDFDIDEYVAVEEDDDYEEDVYDVIRTKYVPLKPQSVDEAILQMNMLGHNFYMFRDDETDEVCIVYARHNGGYGLLIPEKS